VSVSNGKTQGFQRLSDKSVGFALIQLNSEKVALFSGKYSSSRLPDFAAPQLYVPDFFRTISNPWWSFENLDILGTSELESWAQATLSGSGQISWTEPQKSDFRSQVGRIEQAFEQHRIHKAVPTVFSTAKRSSSDPNFVELLARAALNRGSRMLYAFVTEEEGLIGATPEVLFQFDPQASEVQSMALAGTRATELEEREPLLSDPKELHEHNLVLYEIKEKLSGFGEVTSGETHCWNIGSLTHLRTDVSAKIRDSLKPEVLFNYLDKTLHPTPALGVASESVNFTWLRDLPGAKRRYRFGAPFGAWIPQWGAHVLVAIRNIQWTEDQWLLGSGCGYVPESQIDNEWKELELKRASVKALFDVES
jgi:menaquinone-specific isochorismate synthase